MKKRYELLDIDGRYMTAMYDEDSHTLQVTTYLNPIPNVPIEETLEQCGFTITSIMSVEKPKILPITKGKDV